jgi:hypothetical protein
VITLSSFTLFFYLFSDAFESTLQREDELQRRQLLQEVGPADESSNHYFFNIWRMVSMNRDVRLG